MGKVQKPSNLECDTGRWKKSKNPVILNKSKLLGTVQAEMLWLWELWKLTYCGSGNGENWSTLVMEAVKTDVLWLGSGPVLVLLSLCHHHLSMDYLIFNRSVESRRGHRLLWLSFPLYSSVLPGKFRDLPLLGHHHILLNPFQFIIIHPHPSIRSYIFYW
jgi:hypothetical protein